jgi:hypothetical protein
VTLPPLSCSANFGAPSIIMLVALAVEFDLDVDCILVEDTISADTF